MGALPSPPSQKATARVPEREQGGRHEQAKHVDCGCCIGARARVVDPYLQCHRQPTDNSGAADGAYKGAEHEEAKKADEGETKRRAIKGESGGESTLPSPSQHFRRYCAQHLSTCVAVLHESALPRRSAACSRHPRLGMGPREGRSPFRTFSFHLC